MGFLYHVPMVPHNVMQKWRPSPINIHLAFCMCVFQAMNMTNNDDKWCSVVRTNNTINPYGAGGHFCLYILMMQKFRKMIEILANGYLCESTCWSESFPMNTNMTGFRRFSKRKYLRPCALDKSNISIGRVNPLRPVPTQKGLECLINAWYIDR